MNYLITGCNSIVGRKLINAISQKKPDAFFYLFSRDKDYTKELFKDLKCFIFDDFSQLSEAKGHVFDFILHFGEDENIYEQSWSEENKKNILELNRQLNVDIKEYVDSITRKPVKVIAFSTIDRYGFQIYKLDKENALRHNFGPSCNEYFFPSRVDGFLPHTLATQNEDMFTFMCFNGMKPILVRMGTILDRESVAIKHWAKRIKQFRITKLGTGYEPFNWIHSDDAVLGIMQLLSGDLSNFGYKAFNLVASADPLGKTTIKDFCFSLSLVHGYKPFVKVPDCVLSRVYGEKLLKLTQGHYVHTQNMKNIYFKPKYDTLIKALFEIYGDKN